VIAEVRIEQRADLGVLILQRPESINALDLAMVQVVDQQLTEWAGDPSIATVLIDGAGERGLCAGGDIKAMYESARGDGSYARELWHVEYRMNALIASFPKPVCALMHGIVLGGGVGISSHASIRIATANARIGMPEVTIGMIPDVGATWLLSRAPGELGTHLALTGLSIGPADAILCGLADLHVPDQALARLRDASNSAELQRRITELATPPAPGQLVHERDWIDRCYRADSVSDILERLDAEGGTAAETADLIRTKSPIAVAVTLRAVRGARQLVSVAEALEIEYRLACARLKHPDFSEGIRARVIDKDRHPHWNPAALADVREADIAAHFMPAS
jgi:enoyl-CoA hydratase